MGLFHVSYGDLTRDGIEEAIVSLVVIVQGGTARPHIHYIYTIDKTKPKLLRMFDTGDRADGGLRQIYAEKGGLVVERYNSASGAPQSHRFGVAGRIVIAFDIQRLVSGGLAPNAPFGARD